MSLKQQDVSSGESGKLALRQAFGSFATGVTVVTTRQEDGTPRGFTANSFTSVSLDPPLLLVCVAKSALSCDAFASADHFAVNILADHQRDVSGLFASKSPDKFELSNWTSGPRDLPIINGVLASFTCARHQNVDAGDHLVLIGLVLSHATSDGNPLGFYRGAYFDIGLEDRVADVVASGHSISIGAVLSKNSQILLAKQENGKLATPKAPSNANTIEHLEDALRKSGLHVSLGHLYAVFHDSSSTKHSIIYHGVVNGDPPSGMDYYDLFSLSLDMIDTDAERVMLERYQKEFRHGTFGIYHGSEHSGHVRAISPVAENTA